MKARYGALTVVSLLAVSCSLNLERADTPDIARNECSGNADCGQGECWQGACVAHSTNVSSVLLEVSVPTTELDPRVRGFRFLKTLSGISRSSADNTIELSPAVNVVGSFRAAPGGDCGDRVESFDVQVTFTPREDSYGLPVLSYTTKTEEADPGRCNRELGSKQFAVTVPAGSYDVYVQPLNAATSDETSCKIVPQLIRRVPPLGGATSTCLPLPRDVPQELRVVIPWLAGFKGKDSLDGWTLDLVHPVTGHLISETVTLREGDRSGTGADAAYRKSVYFTAISTDEKVTELVRLSPPAGVVAPVIYADRAGLQLASSEATFPPIGQLYAPVRYSGWVRPEGVEDAESPPSVDEKPITGSVLFTAKSLTGILPGVFASHSTNVVVGRDGSVIADLLPGEYRARIFPEPSTGFAATDAPVELRCTTDGETGRCLSPANAGEPEARAGQALSVKRAAFLSGRIVNGASGGPVGPLSVDARPASETTKACAANREDPSCGLGPVGVLAESLGEAELTPRTASGVAVSGDFRIENLDCGDCDPKSGTLFDLLARPQDGSRLPWAVVSRVPVPRVSELEDIQMSLPILYSGTVEVRLQDSTTSVGDPGTPVREASIRAYVLRDERGQWIQDPSRLPTCTAVASGAAPQAASCIKSAVQVAETRLDEAGKFELVLPSELPPPYGL